MRGLTTALGRRLPFLEELPRGRPVASPSRRTGAFDIASWLALLVAGYPYLIYPVLLALLSKLRASPLPPDPAPDPPAGSLLIAARDEEATVASLLHSVGRLAYPAGRLELV